MKIDCVIMHSQRKRKEELALKAQSTTVQHTNVLDELIDNAVGLPVGSQDLLLMMAKAMRHTRNCLIGDVSEQPRKPPANPPA